MCRNLSLKAAWKQPDTCWNSLEGREKLYSTNMWRFLSPMFSIFSCFISTCVCVVDNDRQSPNAFKPNLPDPGIETQQANTFGTMTWPCFRTLVLRPPNQKQHTTASSPGLADQSANFMWGSLPRRHQLGPFLKFGHLTQLVPETSGLVPEYFEVLFVGEQSGSIPNETLCKTQVILGKFKQQSYVYLWKDFSVRQVQHNSVWIVYTKSFIHNTCVKI